MKAELISFTMNPEEVVAMACYTCCSEEAPDRIFEEIMQGDREYADFIKKVIESGHESVLEHANFTFAISGISRACSHQLVRHRIASFTQQSQRYVKFKDSSIITPNSINKHTQQEGSNCCAVFSTAINTSNKVYNELVKAGIKPEDARFVLPNAFTTTFTLTMNARELRHFFSLRCCKCAQWEIRRLANKMLDNVKKVAPLLFENAGAKCLQLGYCNEPRERSCGMMPHKDDVLDNWREHYPKKKKDEEEHEMTQDKYQDYIEKCMTGESLK